MCLRAGLGCCVGGCGCVCVCARVTAKHTVGGSQHKLHLLYNTLSGAVGGADCAVTCLLLLLLLLTPLRQLKIKWGRRCWEYTLHIRALALRRLLLIVCVLRPLTV